jgi:HK97 gp10 family phage protein
MISTKVTSRNRIKELKQKLRPRAGRAINKWAQNTLEIARQLAPFGSERYIGPNGEVHPGYLKRSVKIINYANTVGDARQSGVAKSIAFTAPYAHFVHNGTIYMIPRPFLLAAYEATKQDLLDELAKIFELN